MDTIFEESLLEAAGVGDPSDDSQMGRIHESGEESMKEKEAAKSILEFLTQLRSNTPTDDENDADNGEGEDDDAEVNGMDADDYHNKAVEYARLGNNRRSAEICMAGLKRFPLNVDLLADTIKYSADSGDRSTASKHYMILKKSVPVKCWNWRAFTFAFDYLLEDNPITNEEECRSIIENYKKYIPYEEKAYMSESELEMALGNSERSMKVLEEVLEFRENASQCALRLADMQLNHGLYEKVIATSNYGIAASAEAQPSINVPYLYYIRALAKDHILHKRECNNEAIEQKDVDDLSNEYKLLLSEFPELLRYTHTINMRIKMLKFAR